MNHETLPQGEIYQTTDLALATTIALFYPIEAVDRRNGRKATFLFVRNEHLDELLEQYWKGLIKVEPQAYFSRLKMIKARLYAEG